MKVELDLSGLRDLQRYLAGMEVRVQDFSVPLTDGSKLMLNDILQAIATQGSSWGEPWLPHAEGTVERWGAHPMLDLTGQMIGSLARFVRPTVAGVGANATSLLMEHGRGAGWRGGSDDTEMPDRNIMGRTQETEDAIVEMCLDYAVEESGRRAA